MKIFSFLVLSFLLFTLGAQAETCVDLKTCAKLMYDLKGQRYIWDAKLDENKFEGSPDVELTKEKAELVFTAILDHLGLARLPVGDGKTYLLVRGAMLKEIEAPVIDASAEKAPAFPSDTWDWVTMRYKLKSPEAAPAIEGAYRLHLPREARMQPDENSGFLLVTGTIPVVRQMYETIKAADRPLGPAAREHYKQYLSSIKQPKEAPHLLPADAAAKETAKK